MTPHGLQYTTFRLKLFILPLIGKIQKEMLKYARKESFAVWCKHRF